MARFFIIALVVAAGAFDAVAQDDNVTAQDPFVVVCPVEGMVDRGLAVLIDRAVREAHFAEALVLVVDTPGGLVDAAAEIADSLLNAKCQTIAFVHGKMGATSAGALISFACDHILMAPGSSIGTAAPIMMTSEGALPTSEKEVSFMRAKMRALANAKGHNADIAQAMVDKDIELRAVMVDGETQVYASNLKASSSGGATPSVIEIVTSVLKALDGNKPSSPARPDDDADSEETILADGVVIVCHSGKLLTLTPEEAKEYGVIDHIASSEKEVFAIFELHEAEIRNLEPTWSEEAFRFLTNPSVAGIIIMIALAGLYLEVKTPGFGIPGTVSVIAFILFFGAQGLIGMADWLDVVLILAGMVLLLLEFFIIPGFGIAGVGGIACIVVGFYLSLTDFEFTLPHYTWEFDQLRNAGYTMGLGIASFTGLAIMLWHLLPRTPVHGMLVLEEAQNQDAGYVVQTEAQCEEAIGQRGVALSMLRPAGRGRFGDKTLSVVTHAEFIEKGTPIKIVQVDGNRYVVDKLEETV